MQNLKIEFDWENPQGAQGAELRATWARLAIFVDGQPVTRVLDLESRSVRDGIYVPLYPLAEWIATHWWHVFYESESPGTARRETYGQRHGLRYSRDGYAMPDLRIRPIGQNVEVYWKALSLPGCRIEFIGSGAKLIPARVLKEEFSRFIDATIKRLDQRGAIETLLSSEWKAISEMDTEESDFCKAAAFLGLDPFDVSMKTTKSILRIAEELPKSLYADFLSVAEPRKLGEQAIQLQAAIQRIEQQDVDLSELRHVRENFRSLKPIGIPWEDGYNIARTLRRDLGLRTQRIKEIDDIAVAFKLEPSQFARALLAPAHTSVFDAIVGVNRNESPGFIVERKRTASRNFALCRALFEYLSAGNNEPSIITALHTERQQRSRAFAAEFLAPAQLIRKRLSGDTIADAEVQEIADDFGVSAFVILHQIENHKLGTVQWPMSSIAPY